MHLTPYSITDHAPYITYNLSNITHYTPHTIHHTLYTTYHIPSCIDTDFGAMVDSGIGKEDLADQKIIDELHKQKMDLIG